LCPVRGGHSKPRTGTLLVAEMRLHRIVSEKPFVVEYSKVESVKAEKVLAGRAEDVVRSSGKYLVIRINKDFGKVFKKVVIYPEKEVKCPEPPFVEKYPNSISIACTEKNKWIVFVYVSKDKAEDIYKFYSGGLKKHFKNVGFHFPEDSWEFSREFGIQIESIEVDQWGNYLDRKRKDKPIKSPLPLNGVVFHIVIDKGSPKSFIQDFSFIKIYYSINPDVIKKNIEDHRKLYPPVEE